MSERGWNSHDESRERKWRRRVCESSQSRKSDLLALYVDHAEGYLRYSLRDFLKMCNVAKSVEALPESLEKQVECP